MDKRRILKKLNNQMKGYMIAFNRASEAKDFKAQSRLYEKMYNCILKARANGLTYEDKWVNAGRQIEQTAEYILTRQYFVDGKVYENELIKRYESFVENKLIFLVDQDMNLLSKCNSYKSYLRDLITIKSEMYLAKLGIFKYNSGCEIKKIFKIKGLKALSRFTGLSDAEIFERFNSDGIISFRRGK